MTEFFKRTESHFRFTWEALVSNRLAIHLLSSGSAMYDMVLRQYLHYYQNYDVTLDHFLTGLDTLGTRRLTFQVLDPDELDRFLSSSEDNSGKKGHHLNLLLIILINSM